MQKYTFSRIKTSNHHTFSRILLLESYTFSRINPFQPQKNLSFIHQMSNKYRYLCSQPSQQKDFIQGKQNRDFGYIESTKKHRNSSVRGLKKLKPKLEPLFHHKFSVETGSRGTRSQNLSHPVCKALILNSRLKLHRKNKI